MKRNLLAVVGLLSLLALPACQSRPKPAAVSDTILVLGAFDQEVALLRQMLTEARPEEIEGIEYLRGRVDSRPVVLASTGVGKVNAAMTTTLLLEHCRPTHVIVTGIAGAVDPNLEPGDIVIARQTAHHDMGMILDEGLDPGGVKNRLTGEDNPVFFPADEGLLALAQKAAGAITFDRVALKTGERAPQVVVGTVVTGDSFVASKAKSAELAEKLGADAVEMEGAAVAQLCYQRHIKCLIIRSISDRADESAVLDKQLFYAVAARNSAHLVMAMTRALARGGNAE
jgi:adenosylhomocysteine nucleosidase